MPKPGRVIQQWQHRHGAEIGAHLHHWNTPPFGHETEPEPLASRELPQSLLKAKLENLVTTMARNFDSAPRSFRMGRFDWWPFILELLPEAGLRFDSSMVPLVHYVGRVDQFWTPADPFRADGGAATPTTAGSSFDHGPGDPGPGPSGISPGQDSGAATG